MIRFSVPKILEAAGGTRGLLKALTAYSQPIPERAAIAQWKTRNKIPDRWQAPVVVCLVLSGVNITALLVSEPVAAPPEDPFSADDSEDTQASAVAETDAHPF